MQSTPIGLGLSSPSALSFYIPAGNLLSKLRRPPIIFDHAGNHYSVLVKRQPNADKYQDTCKDIPFLSTGSTVAIQWEDRGLGCMKP